MQAAIDNQFNEFGYYSGQALSYQNNKYQHNIILRKNFRPFIK